VQYSLPQGHRFHLSIDTGLAAPNVWVDHIPKPPSGDLLFMSLVLTTDYEEYFLLLMEDLEM
jgi:hypothetical protein